MREFYFHVNNLWTTNTTNSRAMRVKESKYHTSFGHIWIFQPSHAECCNLKLQFLQFFIAAFCATSDKANVSQPHIPAAIHTFMTEQKRKWCNLHAICFWHTEKSNMCTLSLTDAARPQQNKSGRVGRQGRCGISPVFLKWHFLNIVRTILLLF